MSDEYDFDYGRAHDLLSIVELIAKVAPAYTAISSEAMAELKEINQGILDAVKARKQAADEEAAANAAEEANQGEDILDETPPPNPAPSQAEITEANRRSALAKQSLDTTAGANTPIRRTL